MWKPNHISLTLLATFTIISGIFILPTAAATTPKIYINPPNLIDSTKTPGSKITVDINVADILGRPEGEGLAAYQFYLNWNPNVLSKPATPLNNMNFTDTTSTMWKASTSGTVTGSPSYSYDTGDGNPSPGSSTPSYYVRANATGSQKASILILTEQSFNWTFGTPLAAYFSFAYKVSGNSIDNASQIGARLIKPDTAFSAWIGTKSFSQLTTGYNSWSYNLTEQTAAELTQTGTYKIQLRAFLKTLTTDASSYVQVNWDDTGILIAPIKVVEGSFLKQYNSSTFFAPLYVNESCLYVANTIIGPSPVVSGKGTLVTLTFLVEGIGNTALTLSGTKLKDFSGYNTAHTIGDGWFDNTWSVKFTTWPALPLSWENVVFNASLSAPKEGCSIVSYSWDFGDSSGGTGEVIEHSYGSPGAYTVTLNVTDNLGLWGTQTRQITIVAERTLTQEFTVDGRAFNITIKSNSTVSNVLFNRISAPDQGVINFTVTGPDSSAGFCNVTIPKDIMWGDWTVLIDGTTPPTTLVITSDGVNYYLFFTYTHSTHTVTIISTSVVPEFPSAATLLLILLLATIAGATIGGSIVRKKPAGPTRSRSTMQSRPTSKQTRKTP